MSGFNGVTVDATDGPRWELALGLIDSGEAPVRLGETEIQRSVAGPTADGLICFTVRVGEHSDRETGQAALKSGRRVADEAASADERFAQLLKRYGSRWEIVADYGMGTVRLGEASNFGDLVWRA